MTSTANSIYSKPKTKAIAARINSEGSISLPAKLEMIAAGKVTFITVLDNTVKSFSWNRPRFFNKKPRIFRKNYMLVSKPFELTQFYTDKSPDMKERSTEFLTEKFTEMRAEMDKYLSLTKKERKEYENNCCK